ncbi:MAG: hypothetical protein Q7S52_01740, partial [bacterium]|nr:hypothetical protein [bacterium]
RQESILEVPQTEEHMRLNALWFLALLLTLSGCVQTDDPANPKNVGEEITAGMVDYNNGLYYTRAEGSELGNILSALSAKYPGQTITWGPARTDPDGKNPVGYFIHITTTKGCAGANQE